MKIHHKIYFLLFFVSFMAGATPNKIENCQQALAPSKILVFKPKIEAGSIEHKSPGLVQELRQIASDFNHFSKTYGAVHWKRPGADQIDLLGQLRSLIGRFDKLKQRTQDQRFTFVHQTAMNRLEWLVAEFKKYQHHEAEFKTNKRRIFRMEALTWEVMVACFLDGEKIYVDHVVSELLPKEYSKLSLTAEEKIEPYFDREIDVAVLSRNGSWRWMEVKNWGWDWALSEEFKKKLHIQSWGQNNTRKLLKSNIRLELVMRYELPEAIQEEYSQTLAYDQIHYLFR